MHRSLSLFLATLATILSGAAQSVPVWTLQTALAEARRHSPEVAIAAARLERAYAGVDQAGVARLPRLTLQAGYTQTNNPMLAFGAILNQGTFTPAINFNAPGQVDNLNFTGSIGYNLYRGGQTAAGLAAAHAGVRASEQDHATTFARLDLAITRAYFNIRQAREGVLALAAALATYEESRRIAHLRYDAGQMLKSELLNLEVQLAQTREQQLLMRQQVSLASRQFLYLLGRAPVGDVDLAESDPSIAALETPSSSTISQRPEFLAMEARVKVAAKMADFAEGARRPSVNAIASYQLDHGWRLNGNGDSWVAGIQAEWAVFDGKSTSSKIRDARAQFAEAAAGLQHLELALKLELEQTRLAHEFAVEQLAVTATLIEQADEAARISRARFEAGTLLSAELIAVETRLTEARMRRTVATATERITAAELRRAAGLPLFP